MKKFPPNGSMTRILRDDIVGSIWKLIRDQDLHFLWVVYKAICTDFSEEIDMIFEKPV